MLVNRFKLLLFKSYATAWLFLPLPAADTKGRKHCMVS